MPGNDVVFDIIIVKDKTFVFTNTNVFVEFRQPRVSKGDKARVVTLLIALVMTFHGKVVHFIKETVEPESSRTWRSLWHLTMLMVSVVQL